MGPPISLVIEDTAAFPSCVGAHSERATFETCSGNDIPVACRSVPCCLFDSNLSQHSAHATIVVVRGTSFLPSMACQSLKPARLKSYRDDKVALLPLATYAVSHRTRIISLEFLSTRPTPRSKRQFLILLRSFPPHTTRRHLLRFCQVKSTALTRLVVSLYAFNALALMLHVQLHILGELSSVPRGRVA